MPEVGDKVGSATVATKRAVDTAPQGVPSIRRTRRGGILSEAAILSRIKTAKAEHAVRNRMMDDVMDKLNRQFTDQAKDVEKAEIPLIKSPRGEAIIDLFNALLTSVEALDTQVLPLKLGTKEDELCTNLERGLEGIRFEIQSYTGRKPYPAGIWWFVAKGWGFWKTLYDPYNPTCPIMIEVPDPQGVYPVEGDKLLWVVEERYKYADELRRNFRLLKGKGRGRLRWKVPDLSKYDDIEQVLLTQYTDEDCQALLIDGNFVYRRKNLLGFIPYGISKCRYRPGTDMAWAGQSIIAPILGLLELETELLTKFGTSLSLFFYPRIVAQLPDNRAVIFDGTPGAVENVPFDAKLTVLNIQSNVPEALNLLGQAQSLMGLLTMPPVMSGEPPGQVQAGYPMALLMGAATRRLAREIGQIEFGWAKTQENVLRIIDKFGGLNGGIPIYVQPEQGRRGRKALITLTDQDVQGHFRVKVTLAPKMPQDWVQLVTTAQRMRDKGVDGLPLMSDKWIRDELFKLGAPEEESERILDQMMMIRPEVMEHRWEKWWEGYRKREKIKPPEEEEPGEPDVRALIPPVLQAPQGEGAGMPPGAMPGAMPGMPPTPPGGAPLEEQMQRSMVPPRR